MSRTKRKPYRCSRATDRMCRNHGSCSWCRDDRQHGSEVRKHKTTVDDDGEKVKLGYQV